MSNEIMVKKYSDLKLYFEQKSLHTKPQINNLSIENFDSHKNLEVLNDIKNGAIFIDSAIREAKSGKSSLETVLTPKMKEALEKGTGKLCESHKDGNIFPKIQYEDGTCEFISLENIKGNPNYTKLIILANQAQMQQTLTNIQNILMDFAEETDRQLECILRNMHDDRILKAETVKLNFESYRNGILSLDNLENSINEAFPALSKELKGNLKDLQDLSNAIDKKKVSFGMEKMIKKEQGLINFIIEDLTQLQALENIAIFLCYDLNKDNPIDEKENSLFKVQKRYSDILIDCLGNGELELLSGLSTLPKDIWRENFMPGIESLKYNMQEALLCQKNVQENITALGSK